MKIVPFVLLLAVFAHSCKSHPPKTKWDTAAADTSKFYPLDVFFKEQVQYVDLRNFPLYKITVKDGKKDSAAITKEQFLAITDVFVKRDISAPAVKAGYRESVFNDLSTSSVTLNYVPVDPKAEVQNVDILLDETGRSVKRVFIRSAYMKGDTSITEQISWKTNKSCQVNRSFSAKSGYTSTELNYINWNDEP